MSSIEDKYLKELHKEAAKDFDDSDDGSSEKDRIEEKDGKEDDDKIGRIHDEMIRIRTLLENHLINKKEAVKDEKDEAKDEEKEVEDNND